MTTYTMGVITENKLLSLINEYTRIKESSQTTKDNLFAQDTLVERITTMV